MSAPAEPAALGGLHRHALTWYAGHARELPWREAGRTPWGVLVSEVMLQQTPVARVLPVWRSWMARWPTPGDLAAAPVGDAVRAWGRLGYPRRALRLHECARVLCERHAGEVPDDLPALRALPGAGDYTAAAVAAFAHGRRVAVLDTNVRRVLGRVLAGQALPPPGLRAEEVARAAASLPADPAESAAWNLAVMELGALVCTARAPQCPRCPLAGACAWRLAGGPPYQGPTRRGQPWHGTDRQCRGVVLQALRDGAGPVPVSELTAGWPDADQLDRCVAGLVADGLIQPAGQGAYRLPG